MILKRMPAWGLLLVMALIGPLPAFAQATTGTITGRAIDSSGALLPGVNVSISSPQMIGGAREAVTDSLGAYRFNQVPPGTYQVKFSLTSFSPLTFVGTVRVMRGSAG